MAADPSFAQSLRSHYLYEECKRLVATDGLEAALVMLRQRDFLLLLRAVDTSEGNLVAFLHEMGVHAPATVAAQRHCPEPEMLPSWERASSPVCVTGTSPGSVGNFQQEASAEQFREAVNMLVRMIEVSGGAVELAELVVRFGILGPELRDATLGKPSNRGFDVADPANFQRAFGSSNLFQLSRTSTRDIIVRLYERSPSLVPKPPAVSLADVMAEQTQTNSDLEPAHRATTTTTTTMPPAPTGTGTTTAPPPAHTVATAGKLIGEVKNWNDEQGFGFIIPSCGGDDVFVHRTQIAGNSEWPSLVIGELVAYGLGIGSDGRPRAQGVVNADGSSISVKPAPAILTQSTTEGTNPTSGQSNSCSAEPPEFTVVAAAVGEVAAAASASTASGGGRAWASVAASSPTAGAVDLFNQGVPVDLFNQGGGGSIIVKTSTRESQRKKKQRRAKAAREAAVAEEQKEPDIAAELYLSSSGDDDDDDDADDENDGVQPEPVAMQEWEIEAARIQEEQRLKMAAAMVCLSFPLHFIFFSCS